MKLHYLARRMIYVCGKYAGIVIRFQKTLKYSFTSKKQKYKTFPESKILIFFLMFKRNFLILKMFHKCSVTS